MPLAPQHLVRAVLLALLPLGCAPVPALRAQDAAAPAAERGVPYLTLRDRIGGSDPAAYYGDGRSTLKAGRCDIRERDLQLFAPVADAAPAYLREDLLQIVRLRESTPPAVLDTLRETAGTEAPVLYTHGYYIGFEKGCRRATLLQESAGLTGRFLWFSWPSDGALINYAQDEADLSWSVPHLATAISDLVARFPDRRVHVSGHSLGARGLVLALAEVARRDPDLRLGQVVLLAPDMDFDIFRQHLPRIRPLAEGITVYINDDDRPLAFSAQIHGYPRLGQTGNAISTLRGVEVIDASALDGGGPSGHLYHFLAQQVGRDLSGIFAGRPAAERAGLDRVGRNLWRLRGAPEPDDPVFIQP